MPSANAAAMSSIPLWYRLFFLYIEPVATAVGAYYAWFQQHEYLDLTYTSASAVSLGPSARESIVWSVFLFGLLLADFGHIYSVKDVGFDIYWKFWDWNSMYWGNLGFVYVGAATRTAFLAGVGV